MFRLAYRNFGTWEAMAATHSVDTDGSNRAGVRWYELQRTTGDWGMQQQGTFAPADGLNRWMPSVAMDASGDLAVGYSVSDATSTYPGVRYAGRLVSDPPNELAQGEATLIDGGGSQTTPSGRWGDYSDMTVDPADDCTFWYTQEYVQTTGNTSWRTRIGSFKFPSCGPPPPQPPPLPPPPPPPPPAPPPTGGYTISTQTGQTIIPGTVAVGVHCDDCSRPVAFPFPVTFYGQTFTSANVQSNGALNFGSVNTWAVNGCLPAPFQGKAIFALWDDLLLTNSGQDAYTAVVGSAPHRQFVIEWRGHYGTGGLAKFEVIFDEADGVIRTVYGTVGTEAGRSSTEGVQGSGSGPATQFHCNEAGSLSPGLAVDLHAGGSPAAASAPLRRRRLLPHHQRRHPRLRHRPHRHRHLRHHRACAAKCRG